MSLTWLWLAPLLAAPLVWAAPSARAARLLACAVAAFVLVFSAALVFPFMSQEGVLRLAELGEPGVYGIRYHVAVDGVSRRSWIDGFGFRSPSLIMLR